MPALGPLTMPFLPSSASAQTVSDRVVSGPSPIPWPAARLRRNLLSPRPRFNVDPVDGRQANGDIESAAGKAMNGLTLAAQVAGDAWTEVGPGSR